MIENNEVEIVLEGDEIPLQHVARAVTAFWQLMVGIAKDIGVDSEVSWSISKVRKASFHLAATGTTGSGDATIVGAMVERYEDVGRAAKKQQLYLYDSAIYGPAADIIGVIGPHVDAVRFKTKSINERIEIAPPESPVIGYVGHPGSLVSLGAVRGQVQTISSGHGKLRFTMYDAVSKRAVSCQLSPGSEKLMRRVWGKNVIVEGKVKRDPVTGQAIRISEVSNITTLPTAKPDAWRRAIGIGGKKPKMTPEDAIRRVRDG
jgi:hypothetical protein